MLAPAPTVRSSGPPHPPHQPLAHSSAAPPCIFVHWQEPWGAQTPSRGSCSSPQGQAFGSPEANSGQWASSSLSLRPTCLTVYFTLTQRPWKNCFSSFLGFPVFIFIKWGLLSTKPYYPQDSQ